MVALGKDTHVSLVHIYKSRNLMVALGGYFPFRYSNSEIQLKNIEDSDAVSKGRENRRTEVYK